MRRLQEITHSLIFCTTSVLSALDFFPQCELGCDLTVPDVSPVMIKHFAIIMLHIYDAVFVSC